MIRVTVAYSPAPREVREWVVELEKGATVAQALAASGLAAAFPQLDWRGLRAGVWSRRAGPEQTLRANDRVEVYRPLQVDPKFARRARFRQQGTRAAGLFAKKR